MSWRPLETKDVFARLTVSEHAMLVNASGAKDQLPALIQDGINTFNGALSAIGNNVGPAGTVADQLRNDVIVYIIGLFIRSYPQLKTFWTDQRKDSYKEATDKLLEIQNRTCGAIENPAGYQSNSNNWDSSPRVLGRMFPGVPPLQQWSNQGQGPYWPLEANPNSTSLPPLLVAPDAPKNCWVNAQQGNQLQVEWVQPNNAFAYQLFRGSSVATLVLHQTLGNVNNYIDTAVAVNQTYYYSVVGLNAIGPSPQSNSAFGTVIA